MTLQSTIQIYGRIRPTAKNSKIKRSSGRYWIREDMQGTPLIGFHIPKDEQQGLINHKKENYEFNFNRIFDMDVEQEEIFDVVAKPVVESSLLGYNGTIFAYGQTGSGKTYTITGGAERYADRGLIPRTLQHIFKRIQHDTHTVYTVHISYLEIYNEIGYDLLDSSRDAKKLEDLPKVTLLEDAEELIHLRNLSMIQANTEEDALNFLFVGDTNRMIAETPSNPASSRSHCIFIITLTSRKEGEDVIKRSKLHLVDLAGSERVAKTKIEGSLLKEAQHINLSLHYLEQVIIALHEQSSSRRTHIPYRNSMMTSVLRDSLGGNCMTTMIATLAVEDLLIDESISTCRFAQRVALISNNAKMNEDIDPNLLIGRLKQEISRLKAELAIARGEANGFPDGLPDYEKEKVHLAVCDYVKNNDSAAELLFSDFAKIQHAFYVMKNLILDKGTDLRDNQTDTIPFESKPAGLSMDKYERMKMLIEHRDNEIITIIEQLKKKLGEKSEDVERPVLAANPISPAKETPIPAMESIKNYPIPGNFQTQPEGITPQKTVALSKPKLSIDKAKAFELFKQTYPPSSWIDNQKHTLKVKYTEAKTIGERAQLLRSQMKEIKDQLADPATDSEKLRAKLPGLIKEYKGSYEKLRDMKMEIEHLQHLLEQGRIRMTRDFEAWFIQVYVNDDAEGNFPEGCNKIDEAIVPTVTNDIYNQDEPHSTNQSYPQNSSCMVGSSEDSIGMLINEKSVVETRPAWTSPITNGLPKHCTSNPKRLEILSNELKLSEIDDNPSTIYTNSFRETLAVKPKTADIAVRKIEQISRPFSSMSHSASVTTLQTEHMNEDIKSVDQFRRHLIDSNISDQTNTFSQSNTMNNVIHSFREKSVQDDIAAFYKAREQILTKTKYQ